MAGDARSELYRDPSQPLERRVDDLLARMTLAEKVEQLHGLQREPIDGLYHTPPNERLGIPGFRMVDGPRGVRAGKATAFPVGMARGATFDPDLERRVGEAMGRETSARGGNVLLAPCINLLRHPSWGRAQETYGEDPFHVGTMGAAFVEGVQRHVVASVKHFAVNSIENTRFTVSANLAERTLREVYLPHFQRCITAGAGSVMSAYNRVNGEWCAENAHLLRDVLKGEWAFDGFVESDWLLGMHDTVGSIRAGLDIEMPRPKVYGRNLLAAVESGAVPVELVDDAVRRVLRIMIRFGIFDGRPDEKPSLIACAAHTELAREVGEKSLVLLRNECELLPLDRARLRRIAVVGELAGAKNLGDRGSSYVSPPWVVTVLQGLQDAAGPSIEVEPFLTDAPNAHQLDRIASADAVIVLAGLSSKDEGEGQITAGDRLRLELPEAQEDLILRVAVANPRCVVVLEGGSAIIVERWIEHVPAVLLAWYPGMEGGHAIAAGLFGDVNPGGRLPLTFVRAKSDLPTFDVERDEIEYGPLHGYRLADHAGLEPRFPFGFGLSYTRFAYRALLMESSTLRADGQLQATVEIANVGARAGDEVVQLYVGCARSRVARPVRELKAFTRVHVEAGAMARVELDVPMSELRYWDEDAGGWLLEETRYVVWVGPSSRELPLRSEFDVRLG
ncbi:glycoside hydrolase family 3 C-terminal domain-containing protein [Candidatus Binatia bacterium]|nr:glycoside hydrolase family 3 C-terminal domain-containing protein [Candidatus Binatia bacterium]